MKKSIHIIKWVLLVIITIGIKIFSLNSHAVEKYYSNGVYPYIARALRFLFGWLPFSIGDILYAAFAVYLVIFLYKLVRNISRRTITKQKLWKWTQKLVLTFLVVYVLFYGLWALNYDREGIASQLKIDVTTYSTNELEAVTKEVARKLCETYNQVATEKKADNKVPFFDTAIESYNKAAVQYKFMQYSNASVKPSLFSYVGNYFGFSGYYNPFTGEAQVNTRIPSFVQPFTACHEIGHQLGYAKENEANFAGFLAARHSSDPAFLYSMYFDLFRYCLRDLRMRDTTLAIQIADSLPVGIKNDFVTLRKFYEQYQNPVEPVIRKLYGGYLIINAQPEGMRSYNEVVGMLVAYSRKYGINAL